MAQAKEQVAWIITFCIMEIVWVRKLDTTEMLAFGKWFLALLLAPHALGLMMISVQLARWAGFSGLSAITLALRDFIWAEMFAVHAIFIVRPVLIHPDIAVKLEEDAIFQEAMHIKVPASAAIIIIIWTAISNALQVVME